MRTSTSLAAILTAFGLAACGAETVGDTTDRTCRDIKGGPIGYEPHIALDPTIPQGSIPRDGMRQMARITVYGTAPSGCTPAPTALNYGFIWADGSLSLNIDGLAYQIKGDGASDVEPIYQAWNLANGAAHFAAENKATPIPVSATRATYSFQVDLSQVADPGTLQWRLGGWNYRVDNIPPNQNAVVDTTPGPILTVE